MWRKLATLYIRSFFFLTLAFHLLWEQEKEAVTSLTRFKSSLQNPTFYLESLDWLIYLLGALGLTSPCPSFLVLWPLGLGEGSPCACTCAWVWGAWCLLRNAWHHPMAGVHSWRLQLTSVADVLLVYFCLAHSIQGLLPEDLPTPPPHSCGEDTPSPQPHPVHVNLCHFWNFQHQISTLVLRVMVYFNCNPRSWWPVCGSSHQHPNCQSARRTQVHKPDPISMYTPANELHKLLCASRSSCSNQTKRWSKSPMITLVPTCLLSLVTTGALETWRRYSQVFYEPLLVLCSILFSESLCPLL